MSQYRWVLGRMLQELPTLLLIGLLTWPAHSRGDVQPFYDNKATAEGWVLALLKEGKSADLDERCSQLGVTAAAGASKEQPEWKHSCRQLNPAFLVDLLTKTPWREQLRPIGINISGAWVVGDIDFANARLTHPLQVEQSLISGDVILNSAWIDSSFAFVYSRIDGAFEAAGLRSEMSLDLTQSDVTQRISLTGAKIAGSVKADNAVLDGMNASQLQLGVNMQMVGASFSSINLVGAKVQGTVNLRGSTVRGHVNMNGIHAGNVFLGSSSTKKSTYKSLDLGSAQVAEEIDLIGVTFSDEANLNNVTSKSLFMRSSDTYQSVFRDIDLISADISGTVDLEGAKVEGQLNLNSVAAGNVDLRSTNANRATFKSVVLRAAHIKHIVTMSGAIVEGPTDLNALSAEYVIMRTMDGDKTTFKDVDLSVAKVASSVDLGGSKFEGKINLAGLSTQRLFMNSTNSSQATFKDVDLSAARIGSSVQMQGSLFDGELIAIGMEVRGTLSMGMSDDGKKKGINDQLKPTTFKRVALQRSKIMGHVNMEGSSFEEEVSANHLEVGGDLVMCNIVSRRHMDLSYTRISGNLDARGATFSELDLSGAYITNDLTIGEHDKGNKMGWNTPGDLKLRNARAANLMDVANAWPSKGHLEISGFSFSRLGPDALLGPMRRDPEWWDKEWIQRDERFTPGPYEQLASAFAAAGERGAADDIRFLGRARQRETEKDWGTWVVDMFLEYVAGFGIGDHTFRVLYWVISISGLGGIYLWYAVPAARKKGATWCFGAALSRLLPIIEINKEFTDFFNDPDRQRLTGRQSAAFSAIGLVGWLLGAILVAAVAGLTQKP